MKRHGVRLITAALAAAATVGCFSDPTSSQQNGPALLQLTRSAAVVPIGESTLVEARLVDDAGNLLPMAGATWTTDNAAIADVHVAAVQLPEDVSSKVYVLGIATLGGITTVRVTARGVTDSVRVTALPTRFLGTGTGSVVGTPEADTSGSFAFTAGDSLTITAPAGMVFDPAASVITLGGTRTYLLSRSSTQVSALAIKGYHGRATVSNITWLGNAITGDYQLTSLDTSDSVSVARARLRGTVSVTGDTITVTASGATQFATTGSDTLVFLAETPAKTLSRTSTQIRAIATTLPAASYTGGITVRRYAWDASNTLDSVYSATGLTVARAQFTGAIAVTNSILMTISAPAGTTFNTVAPLSGVKFDSIPAGIISRTATQLQVSSTVNYTGKVTVTNLLVGAVRIDSLKTSGNQTIAKATFPGTVSNGAHNFLDTIVVRGNGVATFTTSGTSSNVIVNGQTAFVVLRTADSLRVIAKASGTAAAQVTNVIVGGVTFPSLTTTTTVQVNATPGDPTEPANNAPDAVSIGAIDGTTAANPVNVYGTTNATGNGVGPDADDFYAFTLGSAGNATIQLQFAGTGAGGATNPDIDLLACDAGCNNFVGGFGGATGAQPENMASFGLAAGQYNIYINGWNTGGVTYSYHIVIYNQ
jgi:hypothetical protein